MLETDLITDDERGRRIEAQQIGPVTESHGKIRIKFRVHGKEG